MSKNNFTALTKLQEYFASLPSIGRKSAERLAYYVLQMPDEKAQAFSKAILDAKNSIHYCEKCCNFTDKKICGICEDGNRDFSTICVVEDPRDVDAIERTGEYNGKYHVLHGSISPINGIGPNDIRLNELLKSI